MKLHSVKISGFKSFADPVTIRMDVPLLCVVGPNGCGKSNIVEAITWVMGESRASAMRGENMQNVIFNGSATRKPMDWCSVEMRLDNSDESGQDLKAWSGYPEIVVKRELERDGGSTYRINNQVVRRRDVHDLFSGTGLGSHGYSVVLQGMVSRIVEDNPAHIRQYLEEAAGVSHYKDRRRETEQRLRRAEENREALENMHQELIDRMEALRRQAAAAVRYREIQGQIDQLRKLALEWSLKELREELAALAEERAGKVEEESRLAKEKKELLEELAALRTAHEEKLGAQNAAQQHFHRMSGAVATISERLKALRKERQDREEHVASLEQKLVELGSQKDGHAEEKKKAEEAAEAAGGKARGFAERIGQAEKRLAKIREAGEREREGHGAAAEEARQGRHLLQTREMQLAARRKEVQGIKDAAAKVRAKREELQAEDKSGEAAEQKVGEARGRADAAEQELAALAQGEAELAAKEGAVRGELAEHEREFLRIETERKLLMSVDGGLGGDAEGWAAGKGLGDEQSLTGRVRLDAGGWEGAVDAALGARLSAFLVEDPFLYVRSGETMPAGIELIASSAPPARGSRGEPPAGLPPLAGKVSCGAEWKGLVEALLEGFYAAPDAAAAEAASADLGAGEHLVTPRGELFARGSVRAQPAPQRGYDWRARIGRLSKQGAQLDEKLSACRSSADALAEERDALEKRRSELGASSKAAAEALRAAENERLQVAARVKWAAEQEEELGAQADALAEDLAKAEAAAAELEKECEGLKESLEEQERRLGALVGRLEKEDEAEKKLQDELLALRTEGEENAAALRTAQTAVTVCDAHLNATANRIGEVDREIEERKEELEQIDETEIVESKSKEEEALGAAEAAVEAAVKEANEISARVGALEARRLELDSSYSAAHDRVKDIGFVEETRRAEIERKREESGALDVEVSDKLREDIPDSETATGRVESLQGRLARMGDINFAAESDMKEAEERLGDLATQREDIREAVENLTGAIARIDDEMRERLKDTYSRVSEKFDDLFGKVFGGGKACLELDGESLLDSGIKIRANPPGKTVDRLHLLSGGEKSLVALSFILAIFSLNPAPFCVMDEVDAALDDHNTAMFSNLLREFSSQVQFLIVTHNKLTADIAERLIGVAQPEKGVSSLVTVRVSDIESFVEKGVAA